MFARDLFIVGGISLFISCFVLAFINAFFGRKKVHIAWAIFNLFVSVWGIGALMVGLSTDPEQAWFWWKVNHIGVIWMPVMILHTAYFFTTKVNKKILISSYVVSAFFQTLSLYSSGLFFKDLRRVFDSFYYVTLGPLYHVFLGIWLSIVIYAHTCIFLEYLIAKRAKKSALLYFLIGSGIGFFGGVTNFLIGYRIDILPFGNFAIPAYGLIVTYAIIKHKLLNIKVALTRGAILLIVYAFIVGIPLVFVALGKPFLLYYFKERWFIPPIGLYTLLALLAPYIYLTLQNKAEHRRMMRQMRLHKSLKTASQTTIEVQSIDKLSRIIPRYLLRLYSRLDNKISQISLFILDKDKKIYNLKNSVGIDKLNPDTTIAYDSFLVKWFTEFREELVEKGVMKEKEVEVLVYEDLDFWLNNPNVLRLPYKGLNRILKELKRIMKVLKANVILPSVYQKDLLGFLILGEKTPDQYTQSDIDTFSILANDSAMAFKAAQLFEDLKTAQSRLIQSEKLNLLGQLASSMAHEINNPLAIISGNVQLLLMDEENEKRKAVLKKINDQTERGYKIINRLLNFSKLSREDIKDIDMHYLIDDTLELVNHKILHANVQLDKEYSCTQNINGNPTQIQEVLLNLFVNAVQAMPEGGRLKISTRDLSDKIEVTIKDTGKGISESDLENIFDPFYTHGKENGTGLGLFVASQVMTLHNGTIEAKSKVGEGTTFVLEFSVGVKPKG